MTVQIRAKSDRGVYLALGAEDGYLVFFSDNLADISLGDFLSHPYWDDRDGPWVAVKNVTKNNHPNIRIENWFMNRQAAYDVLRQLKSPTQVDQIE
jgi:hypothetical protein